MGFAMNAVSILAVVFICLIGVAALVGVSMFLIDRTQTQDAIRRNYPVLGRFRHLFSTLGEFFRQYFFAMDREELPFNRAQREWISRACAGVTNTVAFGSTRNMSVPGTPIFVNAPFPPLDDQYAKTEPMLIGPTARVPSIWAGSRPSMGSSPAKVLPLPCSTNSASTSASDSSPPR